MQQEKAVFKESELLVSGNYEEFFFHCDVDDYSCISVQKGDDNSVFLRAFVDIEAGSDAEISIPSAEIDRLCQALMLLSGKATIARGE